MSDERFKIVFTGEIGFGYELDEVKANLCKCFGFDLAKVERLFSGGTFILKKDIDATTANAFRDALQKQGAFCEIMPMIAAGPTPIPTYVEPQAVALESSAPAPSATVTTITGSFSCPACGQKQEEGESCNACNIVFAKYARAQAARKAREEAALSPPPDEPRSPTRRNQRGSSAPPAGQDQQKFILQCLGVILGIGTLQSFLGSALTLVGLIFLAMVFLGYLALHAAATGEQLGDVFEENLALLTERRSEGEPKFYIPWLTYTLALLNLLLYYGITLRLDPAILANQFAFYPAAPNSWNVLTSAITALFLHAGGWQLWGSLFFLWAVGSVVEERFGRVKFLALYLMTGIVANGAGALAHHLLLHEPLHGLGSAAAIAGLIGVMILSEEEQTLTFSLPLIGAISLFTPLSIKLRLSTFAVIGLFFYFNLASNLLPETGPLVESVGHLAHLGGLLAGMLLARMIKPMAAAAVQPRRNSTPRG